jgi:hypothetical protein
VFKGLTFQSAALVSLKMWQLYTDEYHQVQGDSQMVLAMKRMNRTREVESKRASSDPIRILDVLEAENVRLRNQVAELALQTEILREQVNVN